MAEHSGSRHYVIRVPGVLSERLLMAFPGPGPRTDRGDTSLVSTLSDQSALHGVLAQIEALQLEQLEVRRSKRSSTGPSVESVESVESDDAGSSGWA